MPQLNCWHEKTQDDREKKKLLAQRTHEKISAQMRIYCETKLLHFMRAKQKKRIE